MIFGVTQKYELRVFFNNLFEEHTRIIRIKSNWDNVSDTFDFKKEHEKEFKREIINLNS